MKNIITLLFLFVSSLGFSQVTQRNILANKYSLASVKQILIEKNLFRPYPKTVEEWKNAVSDSILTKIVAEGEKSLAYNFEPITATTSLDYVRSGDREKHGKISYGKRNALFQLILSESIEDKGRFTEAIMNGVWSICEESFWGVPAHISGTALPDVENPVVELFSAETASVLACADYFVGDKLDRINKLIRKRIYYETNKRIFTPLLTNPDKYSWMSRTKPVNNWNPWIMSNWIMSTLLLEKDETRRAEMLHGAMIGIDAYLNGLGEDGGCDEGPSYWFAAGASVYDCLELLQKSTNNVVNIYDNPLIQKMGSYVYKTHIDGYYFTNFADADPKLSPDGLMLYRFGKAINDPQMISFASWAYTTFPQASKSVGSYHRFRSIENILSIKKNEPATTPYQPIKDAWVSDIQVLTTRTDKGLYMASHGGHNAESHNHNDVGDFIVYFNGQPMIVDAGRGNYTARTFSAKRYDLWFTQSQYHNLPIVNEIGQKVGREFEAKNVKSSITDKQASLSLDISAAYPQEANITSWNRFIKLDKVKNQVELSDDFVLSQKPNSLQEIFMTICEVDFSEPGKIKLMGEKNATLTLNYDQKQWTVSIERPSTEGMEYKSFKTKWNNHPVTRIILTSKVLEQKGKYLFTIRVN